MGLRVAESPLSASSEMTGDIRKVTGPGLGSVSYLRCLPRKTLVAGREHCLEAGAVRFGFPLKSQGEARVRPVGADARPRNAAHARLNNDSGVG